MKIQKTNTVQLIIAGFVVVLVAVCSTFAWFAVSDTARVDSIGASAASPSIESGVSEIQYKVGEEWQPYDGGSLRLIPGEVRNFRVIFYASSSQNVTLKLTNISSEKSKSYEFTDQYGTAGALPLMCKALEYRVNPSGDNAAYTGLESKIYFDGSNENKPSAIIDGPEKVDPSALDGQQYTYYYDITLPGTAGNEYQDEEINFNLELIIS
ncbi:MAG: hypothetical protein IJ261_05780 [Clostridia bacterium]|nr:hypothetical protein [Clostridia bacterium]